MTTESEQPSRGIDSRAYNAAIRSGTKIDSSRLKEALSSTTPGSRNTLLHVAATVGNLEFIQEILRVNPLLVKATNAQGNTALHLAAQGGFSDVVKALLQQPESGADVRNKLNETALFKAYERGDLATVKALFDACPSSLNQKTAHGRSCLYVAIVKGNSELLMNILESKDAKELIQLKYENGDTALHVATGKNYVDIMKQLTDFQPELCYWVNDSQETPLCIAAKLGHLEAVEVLMEERPDAVEIRNSCGMNVLHLAAQLSQVRIVDYLNQKTGLLDLVNQGFEKPPEEKSPQSRGDTDPAEKGDPFSKISEGDTPLHIAARNKSIFMVDSLLRIPGINKDAVNKEGLTALDIARENTEYYEPYIIIRRLGNYPPNRKPFLYSAPKVSIQKRENLRIMVNEVFKDKQNIELVVAVLLATMSFTATFTIPGGFKTEVEKAEEHKLGTPLLIGFLSFKMFIIFNCAAFFLSLFVVIAWQIATPQSTEERVSFLIITNLMIAFASNFTAYAFIAAVYTMLEHSKLAWLVLGVCLLIALCASLCIFHLFTKFLVKHVRGKHLAGVYHIFLDHLVEDVWINLEEHGFTELIRCCKTKCLVMLYGHRLRNGGAKPKRGYAEMV